MNLLRPVDRYLRVKDLWLHYLDWGGEGRTPLLLLHNFTEHAHAWNTLVQSGRMFEIGGGATYPLTSNGSRRLKQIGARIDARAVLRANGAAFDDSLHVAPALGASLYFRF